MKAKGLPEIHDFSLCHEFLGCRLAMRLGLAAPTPALVEVSPEFLEASKSDLASRGLKINPGLAVGIEYIPNLQTVPTPVVSLEDVDVDGASRIYAFDLLIQNPDRTAANPNCGRNNGQLVPYDYENAFSFRFALLKGDPCKVTELQFVKKHLFFNALREKAAAFESALSSFKEMADDELEELCGTLPDDWQSMGAEIHAHLVAVRSNWPVFRAELDATMKLS